MTLSATTYVAAFVVACFVSAVSVPVWRVVCRRLGLIDDPGHRKIHHSPIPLAGGLAVATGLFVPLAGALLLLMLMQPVEGAPAVGFLDSSSAFLLKYGFGRRALELGGIVLGALGMLTLGVLDDRLELRPLQKFGAQLLVACLVAASGVRITLFVPSAAFSLAITVLWLLTLVNAFNFMDNMNGLCSGLGFIAATAFGAAAAMQGQYLVGLLSFLSAGALLGFLPFNYPKATAFLGDGGSHLVGFLMAVLAILPHFHNPENPKKIAVLTPLLVLAVPLLDMAWVVILRWRKGQPFYQGDTNHLSHRLVRLGLSPAWAVASIWAFAVAFALLGLLLSFKRAGWD